MLFIALFIGYVIFLAARHYLSKFKNENEMRKYPVAKGMIFFILGIVGLTAGAKIIVDSASKIAVIWGITETIIVFTFRI